MYRWKFSPFAAAACVCAALTSTEVAALALGSVSVQSYLGQPLRALVEVPELSAEEESSLQTQVPALDVFQAHGLEYGDTARDLQIQVQRHADGSVTLQLSTRAPVNEAFVHLIIQANWKTSGYAGNLMRSYTLLLDPAPTPPGAQNAQNAQARARVSVSSPAHSASTARPAQAALAATSSTVNGDSSDGNGNGSITVRPGDTAGRIAAAHRLEGVSLEQMLVAMLRHNPRAFIRGNIHRLRAGAILQLPGHEAAQATSPQEARRLIATHHRSWVAARTSPAARATR